MVFNTYFLITDFSNRNGQVTQYSLLKKNWLQN